MKQKKPINLVWCGHVFAPAGFDDELRNFLAAVDTHCKDIRQKLIPLNRESSSFRLERPIRSLIRRLTKRRTPRHGVFLFHLYMGNVASLLNQHFKRPAGSGIIIRTTFEPDRLLPAWVDYLNRHDEVWVPSEFNRTAFSASGVLLKKIVRIPETIDVKVYDQSGTDPLPEIRALNRFVFLAMMPVNKLHLRMRKGIDILLKAYMNEFKDQERAALVLHMPFSKDDSLGAASCVRELEKDMGLKIARRKDIIFHCGIFSNAELPRLYRSADAFVLPSRGEGWGRLYMEAMAMGLPTIGTRWGGNLDFMNDRNSYLIDCRLADIPPTADMPIYWRHSAVRMRWAQPSMEHLQSIMRFVFEHRGAASALGARARQDIVENYNARVVARLIEKNLRRFLRHKP